MGSSYSVNKKPWKAILILIDELREARIEVGLFDGEVAKIGFWHEFGTETIPERPWLRSTFTVRADEIAAFQARIVRLVLARKITVERAMNLYGEYVVTLIREQIVELGPLIFTPLAPATIAAKGGKETPLVHTGQMLNAISYRVLKGAG